MDDALRDLQQVMAAHRRALATSPLTAAERPPDDPGGAQDRQPDERRRLMRRLAVDLERVCGIEMSAVIEGKLGRALASVGLGELAGWVGRLGLLPPDHPEWLSLIESLTVHETFFHRDRAQLGLLAGLLPGLIAAAADCGRHTLRLWSAGCATGEEAYTLAILALSALRQAGFATCGADGGLACRAPWRIDVLGTDISRLVLVQAKAAVYSTEGLSSFRELPRELRHFLPLLRGGGAPRRGVLEAVRRLVRFRHFNLIADAPPETGFDIVLCRNVLIYLSPAARIRAQSVLRQALRPGGWLLLGPTDGLAAPAAYEPSWGAGAVAYALKPR